MFMSRLDDLIRELCPDGVEFKELGDKSLFHFHYGKGNKIPKNGGAYPVYGCNGIVSSTDTYNCENVSIIGHIGSAGIVNWCSGKAFVTYNGTIADIKDKSKLDSRYLYYVLLSLNLPTYVKGSQPFLSASDFAKVRIPIPPLEVQQEIVRLLDDFTAKTAELQAELNKEYEARKKQYDCYKDMLIKQSLKQCNAAKLSNIASVYDGTHQTPEYKNEGVPFISVENIDDIYSSNKYITLDAFNKYKIKPQVNDVFMTRIGSIGKCSIMTRQENLAYYVSLALIRLDTSLIDPRYFKHYIESPLGKSELYKRTLHHAVPIKINKDDIGKITIKYPDLNTQKEITSILDNLDSMHNEFILTLKSEIESRQKQYEYFRDKLLTFKELN